MYHFLRDCMDLQLNLWCIFNWFAKWCLKLNLAKCVTINFLSNVLVEFIMCTKLKVTQLKVLTWSKIMEYICLAIFLLMIIFINVPLVKVSKRLDLLNVQYSFLMTYLFWLQCNVHFFAQNLNSALKYGHLLLIILGVTSCPFEYFYYFFISPSRT